ncbi:myelin regulatory factor isoform X2 [Planococcus citri]|uniref:myelin regulatory factor isoform X2 n=1 Tax=Planococcus citri TaxID=170843 RepID=UPI0031F89441
MELNAWTLVEQDGEHVLHNSNNMLHGNLMHSVQNPASECNLMSMDVCQEASSRSINRIVIDRRLHGQEERNDYVGGIDNESLDFSQLEDFINNETDSDPSYFGDTLSHDNTASSHLPTNVNGIPGNVDQNPANRTLHPHHLAQSSHQSHLLNKNQVVSANISAVAYNTTVPNISLDSTYTYAHSHHSLPESPPDSGSEPPYSPPDVQKTTNNANIQEILLQTNGSTTPNGLVSLPYVKSPLQHAIQMQNSCGETILLQHSTILTPLLTQQQQQQQQQHQNVLASPISPGLSNREGTTPTQLSNLSNGDTSPYLNPHNRAKKRKLSQDSSNVHVKQEPELPSDAASSHASALAAASAIATSKDDDYGYQDSNSNGPGSVNNDSGVYLDSSFQCIRFQPFQQSSWHALCDQNLKELPVPHYRVDADKGFNFSNADDAFVCQKKNHFQITCHAQLEGEAQFVKTSKGIRKISSFHLHFYGVKVESPSQTIKVEQSQSDRSKKAFHPVLIDLRSDQVTKVTVGRLHFSETTSNNMRKKGKPNPDQRYFYLVVGLHAHCNDSSDYPIVSHSSEKIIVRASNPGQFENDVELCWQRGSSPESVFHAGRVGINTDRPDEALVVHGNVKVTGHIMKPSDTRIKTNIQKCDHKEQLRNIQQLNVVRFTYSPEFSTHFGLVNTQDTGVIAQEVQKVLPEAVTSAGSIVLPDGTKFENFLLVDKERIYMENVGAVKELCKVTDNLETRIDELERMNRKLVRLRRHDSTKSTSSYSTVLSGKSRSNSNISGKHKISSCADINLCSNHYLQVIIIGLVFVIAGCLASIATLYFLEFRNAYTANLSSYWNNEKINRLRSEWSASTPPQWSSIMQSNEFGRHNITDLKLIHHMPNKLRSKDRQTSSFSYQPSVSDYPLDSDSVMTNFNQKITKHKLKPSLQVNNLPHNLNPEDKVGDSYAVNDLLPTALGRPSHCNTIFSSHNSLLHYWDTPSPCQSFCCFPGVFHNSGDENDQASQDSLKAKVQDQGQASTDFIANIGQMTPAANTLEDTQIISALGYTSKDSISGLGQEQHFIRKESKIKPLPGNKNSIELLGVQRRRRYAAEPWSSNGYSNTDQYQKGINDGITVSVHGSNFNQTINSSYCNIDKPHFIQCKHGSAANISYIIPLSKYLSDNHIYLIFQFSKVSKYQKVTRCLNVPKTANVECPAKNLDVYWMKSEQDGPKVPNETMKNFSRTDAYFHVDISNSLVLLEKYRVYTDNSSNLDICEASSEKLGVSYLEYNFYFLRHCEE